jgi:outer membrane protein assembly factor BamE (lipoprotein component of BamABCDE complex)/outer membrane murein-binding lipoprotein Lpp
MRNPTRHGYWLVVVILVLLAGCSSGPSEEELAQQQAQEQLTAVRQAYADLQQLRADIAADQTTINEIEAVPETKRTDEQKAQLEELGATLEQKRARSEETYDGLQAQLADFLNVALNTFPNSPETAEALKIYADEAILVADDIVAKAGDYKKAINHLSGAKGYYDAVGLEVYPALLAKIDELDSWSFITEERFAEIKKGMTKDEVKAVAGVPYYGNIQEDEKRGVETWLYKKREGGAAAVYFKIKTGKVYSTNFDAVKIKVAEE